MNKIVLMGLSIFLGMTAITFGAVIDFTGGTAYLSDGTSVVTDNFTTYYDVDYYIEDGFKIDFVNGYGIIGNYYGDGWPNSGNIHNSVSMLTRFTLSTSSLPNSMALLWI